MKTAVGLLILAWLATPAAWPSPQLQKRVLILGIDGTMPSALAVAQTPNLDALKTQGAFSDRAVTHPVTHSAACWTSMFTGVWGDKHGVNDPGNSFAGNRFDLYPNLMQRLELANSNLLTVAYLRWAPLSNALARTEVIQAFTTDAAIVNATCQRLTNSNPDVFYTILLDVDSAGHSYGWGPTVSNYVKAIETADTRVGQIIQALTNRASYAQEDWLVFVLSDHGQHDSTVERSQLTFHLAWGPSAGRGTILPTPAIVDVCTTVLTHMGLPPDPAWNLDGRLEGLPKLPTPYGTNLVCNGDAEANSGTNNYTPNRGIAWWWDYDGLTLGRYGQHPAFPTATSPGPTNRGRNFFLGGPTNASMSQTIDISDLAADIDSPGVDYVLSGWLGGKTNQTDSAMFTTRFLDPTGALLASTNIGPVTAVDRGSVTGLLERTSQGTLPAGTRRVEFMLATQAPSGSNDGSADNLSFVLTPRADPQFPVRLGTPTGAGWPVDFVSKTNRLYELERSQDLRTWTTVSPPVAGTGQDLSLVDTNPPAGQAFYRVNLRRP